MNNSPRNHEFGEIPHELVQRKNIISQSAHDLIFNPRIIQARGRMYQEPIQEPAHETLEPTDVKAETPVIENSIIDFPEQPAPVEQIESTPEEATSADIDVARAMVEEAHQSEDGSSDYLEAA